MTLNEKYNEEYIVIDKLGLEGFLRKHNLLKKKNIFNEILNPNLQSKILSNTSYKQIEKIYNINSYNFVKEHLYPHISSGNILLSRIKINKVLEKELNDKYINIRVNEGGLYETLLYIQNIKNKNKKLLNPLILKTKVLNYIKEEPKLWENISKIYEKYDTNFKNITKVNKFSEVFLDQSHKGYNEELIFINKIFGLNIILLNHNATDNKNLFICLGSKEKQVTNEKNRFIIIDYDKPNIYSLIIYNDKNKNITKSIFTRDELPNIFFKKFEECNK